MQREVNGQQHNIAQAPSRDANHLHRTSSRSQPFCQDGQRSIYFGESNQVLAKLSGALTAVPRHIGQSESETGLVRSRERSRIRKKQRSPIVIIAAPSPFTFYEHCSLLLWIVSFYGQHCLLVGAKRTNLPSHFCVHNCNLGSGGRAWQLRCFGRNP